MNLVLNLRHFSSINVFNPSSNFVKKLPQNLTAYTSIISQFLRVRNLGEALLGGSSSRSLEDTVRTFLTGGCSHLKH